MRTSLLMNNCSLTAKRGIAKSAFLLLILFLLHGLLVGQDISVKSFQLLPDDLTARVDAVTNDNGQTCALVKMVTTERGFVFETDGLGMCKAVDESQAGEVWIWLSPGSRRLTIKHKALGVLRNYEYPVSIEGGNTYEMVLVTGRVHTYVEELNTANYLVLSVSPPEAMVKIDGSMVFLKDGCFSNRFSLGEHRLEVFCDLYYPVTKTFKIEPDNKTVMELSLAPNFGYIVVNTQPESGAAVYVNGRLAGETPYQSDKMAPGTYTVQVVKEMYKDAAQQVKVSDNQTASVTLSLSPNFAEPVFICNDGTAQIWVNGEQKGVGRWSGRLPVGPYRVEARKESHRPVVMQLDLVAGDNGTRTLDAPTPIQGKIDVSSTPFGADILLDGKKVGVTPEILNQVLEGKHELRISKAGYTPVTRTVIVEEGKTAEVSVSLSMDHEAANTPTLSPAPPVDAPKPSQAPAAPSSPSVSPKPSPTPTPTAPSVSQAPSSSSVSPRPSPTPAAPSASPTPSPTPTGVAESQKIPKTQEVTVKGVNFKMVAVTGGSFTMGCTTEQGGDCLSDETPAHRVTLKGFCIGETEVTQALWKAVMGSNPSHFKGDNLPVENVNWDEVQDFVKKLNQLTGRKFRLPTEAEWEYAARGGKQSRGYKHSGSDIIGEVAWYTDNSGGKTHPVKTKKANELGLYDMNGNVWELCNDWFGGYNIAAQTNPTGPAAGFYHVNRGGCWGVAARNCRITNRNNANPGSRSSNSGFRLVMEP